jgi:hypothetical protein
VEELATVLASNREIDATLRRQLALLLSHWRAAAQKENEK